MKYFKIEKKCPFCPGNPSDRTYRTFSGLYRHVFFWHALTDKGEWWSEHPSESIRFVRIFKVKFSKFIDIQVNGRKHLEALLEEYCKEDFNPSLRKADLKSFEKFRSFVRKKYV